MPEQTSNVNDQKAGAPETVAKADYDAKIADLDKARQELEDMRLEVFSPDYLAFLDDKGKPPKTEPVKEPVKDDDLSKLTPAQLFAKAKEETRKEFQAEIEKAKTDAVSTVGKEQSQKEVAAFARSHADYETWRPVMYGLSLDPKNKELSLDELYTKAKDHVTRLGQPSAEEKARQAKLASEKPGGSSESFEKYTKMTPEQIGKESLEEVKAQFGGIPPAV
uniref:Uncharacterized protein n=1 Tax=viral metagenome TaxID=1070528 RepID=A0A6M3KYU6_9ZZZZ